MTRALSEVEVAAMLGFRRFRDFARSLRAGQIPRPDAELCDGPRWSETALAAWLSRDLPDARADETASIIRRLRDGRASTATRADRR